MKYWIYLSALTLGIGIGWLLFHSTSDSLHRHGPLEHELSPTNRTVSRSEPNTAGMRRLILSETEAMDEKVPLDKALEMLSSQRKSPLRVRAFLKSRIQWMTTDQLNQALMNGEIQTRAELQEAIRRLAREDPEGTFNHLEAQHYPMQSMDNIYIVIDGLLQTWADTDAPAVMARLQKMKRGGSQQDMSLRFSDYWAKINPAEAADHFNDLIYLRNMQNQGTMVFTDDAYARRIVQSWQEKDESAMRHYIAALSPGEEKNAFENALKNLKPSNP